MRWLRSGRHEEWSLDTIERPWTGESLYDFVANTLDADGRWRSDSIALPDEDRLDGVMRWAPGAMEGIFGGAGSDPDTKADAKRVRDALSELITAADASRLDRLYRSLTSTRALSVADLVFEDLHVRNDHVERLGETARLLVRQPPDREPVKFGIALLALVGDLEADGPTLERIGGHEEFTLFAVVALRNLGADDRRIWQLAKRVDGWGRIETVRQLTETTDPEIRAWMLRGGYRNEIMDEYLAWPCAMTGGLADALESGEVDDALLRGATGILGALARGGPAQDLGDYADAERTLVAWLDLLERRGISIDVVCTLDDLATCEDLPSSLAPRVQALRHSDAAATAIRIALEREDDRWFAVAHMAATERGLDAKGPLFEHAATGDGYAIDALFDGIDEADLDRALEIMRTHLDLHALASGPSKGPIFGPAFEPQMQLETVVTALQPYRGRGTDFVLAALSSPSERGRIAAIRTSQHWDAARDDAGIREALRVAREREPDEEIRRLLDDALAGRGFLLPEPTWDDS